MFDNFWPTLANEWKVVENFRPTKTLKKLVLPIQGLQKASSWQIIDLLSSLWLLWAAAFHLILLLLGGRVFTKSCQESSSYQVSPFFPDCVISGRLKTRENPKFPSFGWVGVCFPFVFSPKFFNLFFILKLVLFQWCLLSVKSGITWVLADMILLMRILKCHLLAPQELFRCDSIS